MDPLSTLAALYGSDKLEHGFCGFYHRLLAEVRDRYAKVLEIGVFKGASLRMWRDYFPRAAVHGFDLSPPIFNAEPRIALHQGDQANRRSLNALLAETGPDFDLIIDDGGHTMEQQQVSFAFLFPLLRPGGLYIIEDLHTSFAQEIGWYRDGRRVGGYPTGVQDGGPTTFELVQTLAAGRPLSSLYLSAPEIAYLQREALGVEIFDRDGDRAHLTCALRRRG